MTFNLRITKIKLLLFVTSIIFLTLNSYLYHQQIFSIHFGDEDYNFFMGKFLLDGGIIYKETFANHQPLAYLISSAIQYVVDPNSIFLLVKRHREFMILFSFTWLVFLTARFGLAALLFAVVYEINKFALLGNLFLPESLVVYPLIFLLFLVFTKTRFKEIELFLVGFILGFLTMLLAPLWPLNLFFLIYFLFRCKNELKKTIFIFLGILLPIVISFYFTDFRWYLHDSVFINLKYFIPLTSQDPSAILFLKSLITPVLSFIEGVESSTLKVIQIISVVLFINLIILSIKKQFKVVFFVLFILSLANLRYITPGLEIYQGFHMLPWFSLLVASTFILSINNFRSSKSNVTKYLLIFLIIVSCFSVFPNLQKLIKKRDVSLDHYINYSQQFTDGEIIKIISNMDNKNTLFVAPDEWLVYWQSGLYPPGRINSYYDWMENTPPLANEINNMFNLYPPTFIYCNCSGENLVTSNLTKYKRLKGRNDYLNIYISEEKYKSLTDSQRNMLVEHGVNFN